MAKTKAPQRVNLGNRLFRVGSRFYIRVGIPRDLKEEFRAEGRKASEVFEPLKASDRRDAERECRYRGAEIDADFQRRRALRQQAEQNIRPATAADIDAVARQWYRSLEDVAREREEMGTPAEREAAAVGREVQVDELSEAFSAENYAYASRQADAALAAAGLRLDKDSAEYRRLCQLLMRAMLESLEQAQRREALDFSETTTDRFFRDDAQALPANGITLGELVKRYEKDRGANWTKKTKDGYVLIFRALGELLGADRPVKSITREDCRKVRDILADLAPNYTKLPATRGKPMEEAAVISRTLELPRRKPESVNSYLNNLAALFNYAVEEEYADRHPAKKLQLATTTRKKDKRNPFALNQLEGIFNTPLYTGCANDAAGYAVPGPAKPRRGRFWVPLISLFHGMRLNECCQLLTSDIREMDGVWCIIISEDPEPGADEADRKRVKTAAGERFVPLHPELERLGFLDYWRKMQGAGSTRLFPDLPKGLSGYYSDPFSKWFGRFLTKAGVKTRNTSFHSFRHSYRDALREADISAERVKALGGWANSETHEDYGSGLKPSTLRAAMVKVQFPGLDLSHLYP